jgi:UDP-glucuronate decarboxylase
MGGRFPAVNPFNHYCDLQIAFPFPFELPLLSCGWVMKSFFRIVNEDAGKILHAPLPWENLAGTTVLVTGAAGMLGAYVVRSLVVLRRLRGVPVRVLALVRDRARAEMQFADLLAEPFLSVILGDVAVAPPAVERVDFVVHGASPASPKYYPIDPIGVLLPNTIGTLNLLRLAEAQPLRQFLFVSSPDVYGYRNFPASASIPEDGFGSLDPLELRACYAESKRMGEAICAAWQRQKGIRFRIARPAHSFGPGLKLDDGRVFADFVADVVRRRDIILKSDGRATRALCYLTDTIEGLFTILLKGADGEAYNIANNTEVMTIRQMAELVAGLVPEYGLSVRHHLDPGYSESPVKEMIPISVEKIAGLGWRPKVSLAEAFRRTILSFS